LSVANPGDGFDDPRLGQITLDVVHAAAVGAHDRHDDLVIRASPGAKRRPISHRGQAGSNDRGLFEELAPIDGSFDEVSCASFNLASAGSLRP